jgi:protein TonB
LNFKSTITGIAASAILLAVLGIARLFTVPSNIPDLEIREVDTVIFEPPPPPPVEETPDTPPPPPPALMEVSSLPDPTRIPVPRADVPMDITAPVEDFFADLEPAPLPSPPKPPASPKAGSSQQFFRKEQNYQPAAKSRYSAGELDSMPRVLSYGSFEFPSSLARKGVNQGTVTLEVEISASGASTIRRVISSTHPELIPQARRVATGARFTVPKHKGKPVKAILSWPIVLKK